MAYCVPKVILLTGVPGAGKTTLIKKVAEQLKSNSVKVNGFYTEEERVQGQRTGFNVITLDGEKGLLARLQNYDIPQGHQYTVGKYTVCLQSFEVTALPTLQIKSDESNVVVIDEIGKMELFSHSFIRSVRRVLNMESLTVIATIPVPKGRPLQLVEEIRSRKDALVYTVTKENRDSTAEKVINSVMESIKHYTSAGATGT